MNDKERQKLCDELNYAATRADRHGYYGPLCGKAASEIERLADLLKDFRLTFGDIYDVKWVHKDEEAEAALGQSDAEPVAWLLKPNDGCPAFAVTNEDLARDYSQRHSQYSVFPLFTAPPRLDASAGLIEEIRRLTRENDILKLGAEAWPEILKDRDERLDALSQSDAEPPMFQCPVCGGEIPHKSACAPPRPDASAGLIEAAEWHEELAREKLKQAQQAPEAKKRRFLDISFFHDECASALRARAADKEQEMIDLAITFGIALACGIVGYVIGGVFLTWLEWKLRAADRNRR